MRLSAANACESAVGRFASIEGEVKVRTSDTVLWNDADLGTVLCEGDTVKVGARSRAAIQLINSAVLRLDENTTIRLMDIAARRDESSRLYLDEGLIQSFSRRPALMEITTPQLKAQIKGTEFVLSADNDRSSLGVIEGLVQVASERGELSVAGGQQAVVQRGSVPRLEVIPNTTEMVQWSLFYPPILAVLDGGEGDYAALRSDSRYMRDALSFAQTGRFTSALAALDGVPVEANEKQVSLLRAALELAVGRTKEARSHIESALGDDALGGLAYSLSAVMNVVQLNLEAAEADAERAWRTAPSPAGALARTYVLQARLKLKEARDSAIKATLQYPTCGLLWARLAELQLMLGERVPATEAANRALALMPYSSRAFIAKGYTELANLRMESARTAFEQAIARHSSDPAAHLGLGLVLIKAGDLETGRREIELAVALDSTNALYRSYLGKAYFEEGRSAIAAEQYAMAKSLDPADPTPYSYEGLRLQNENLPTQAIRELQRARKLNENRAIYRGPELLGKDSATRGASLARAYRETGLGFLGMNTATESINRDPTNPAAHRFLADVYLGVRRREIARVSELLQAQLLQDVSLTPLQPSVLEANINAIALGGVSPPGYNEFDALYQRNGLRFDASGFAGSFATFGGEGIVSAMQNGYALSVGSYYYGTDGWRRNNGLEQTIVNVQAQAAIHPDFNVQVEFRRRQSDEGDLAFNFEPNRFDPRRHVDREQETTRVGARYAVSPRSTWLFSYLYGDRMEDRLESLSSADIRFSEKSRGSQFEGQWLFASDGVSFVTGAAYSEVERNSYTTIADTSSQLVLFGPTLNKSNIAHGKGYVYANFALPRNWLWTLGVSFDDYNDPALQRLELNPKAGLRWAATDDLQFRVGFARYVKPVLVNNRTLEPTQVAGFNQLFDDPDGTISERYGGGFDWHITDTVYVGGEASWRHLIAPTGAQAAVEVGANDENRDEQLHSVYLSWLAMQGISLRAEFSYDLYRSGPGLSDQGLVPRRLETFAAPFIANVFHPSGLWGQFGVTFVSQSIRSVADNNDQAKNDSFALVDASLGYRLPRRYGHVSFSVKNLFDNKFRYQDDSFREFRDESSVGPYFPERIFMGRIVLSLD